MAKNFLYSCAINILRRVETGVGIGLSPVLLSRKFIFHDLVNCKNYFQRQKSGIRVAISTISFKSSINAIAFILYFLSCHISASEIVFSNFSQKIILNGDPSAYVLAGIGLNVSIANRLIVKTSEEVTAHQMALIDPDVTKITTLYEGKDFNYFLVNVKSDDINIPLDKFRDNKLVLLVQPDILQSRKNASLTKNNSNNSRQHYLEQLGITSLWKETRGAGVRLAIIDDGIDLNHPALAHTKSEFLYDTQTHQLSAQPTSTFDSHGTKVAGIIFATQVNQGLQGIAPEAQLIAIRQPDTWTSNTLLAFQLAKLARADIVNCSWNTHYLLEPIADVVNDMANHGREGKGVAIIFSAGNEGVPIAQLKTEATINSAITVGALDAKGTTLASSNYGEGVDIYIFGEGVKSTDNQRTYHQFSGTSLSAAIASGMAALLISKQPDITLKQLQQKIQGASNKAFWLRKN